MEIYREVIHGLHQLDRQHCFAVYLRISFQLAENSSSCFPAIAKIELAKTFKSIFGPYTRQHIKSIGSHTGTSTMKMPFLLLNYAIEKHCTSFMKFFHAAEFFSGWETSSNSSH